MGVIMEKIIVRKKIVIGANSRFAMSVANIEFHTLNEYLMHYGKDYILSELFMEDKEIIGIIQEQYLEQLTTEKSDLFSLMYKLNDDFALLITEHIYLYHLEKQFNIGGESLTDWYYVNSEKYIGDAWWFDDDEILNDIGNLSITNFIKKYKGY